MMLRFHQYPPKVFALAQFEFDEIITDAEARTGTENFDLPEEIIVQLSGLIQIFSKKDIFRYFVEDLLSVIELVLELGKKCPHIEGGRHSVGTAEINSSNKPGRRVIGILSDKNVLGMEISVPLYQFLRAVAVGGSFELDDPVHNLLCLPGMRMTGPVKGRDI